MSRVVGLFLLAALVAVGCARPLTADDLVGLYRAGTPVPNGAGLYVVPASIWDKASNKKTQSLYVGSTTPGSKLVPLAAVEGVTDYSPVWQNDDTVLFLSTRGNGRSVWTAKASLPDVPAVELLEFPVAIDNLHLSANKLWLAFSAQVYPGLTLEETAARDAEIAAGRSSGAYIIDGLFARRWDEWWLGKFNHVFVMFMSCRGPAAACNTGAPIDVMSNMHGDCPSRPNGGAEEFAFAPSSSEIAFTTQVGPDMAWSTDLNVYTYDLAQDVLTCVSCDNIATDTGPAYSPDGDYLAYLAMAIPAYESDTKHIVVVNRDTNEKKIIAQAWDRSVDKIEWSDDSKTIIATASDRGRNAVFAVDVATGKVASLVPENDNEGATQVPCFDDAKQTCLLYSRSNLTAPADVWTTSAKGVEYQLTNFNAQRLSGIDFSAVSEYYYAGANGDKIQAWVHLPLGFKAGQKYPLVLYIHGGPESPWFNAWSYRWNPQVIAAQGYAVIAPNFHGSGSFGSNFTQSILKDWGGKPFQDLMIAVKTYTRENPWVDVNRIGAMGASYGGYMINWINGNTNGVFKCLVCHDGFFDTVDQYYSTDELYFPEKEFGGAPFDTLALENYRKFSPSTYAAKFSTPELVIQGGKDYRITESSGLSTFNLLQRRGIPSKFLYFPNENHWCLNPNNSLIWHDQVIAWLAKWLKA